MADNIPSASEYRAGRSDSTASASSTTSMSATSMSTGTGTERRGSGTAPPPIRSSHHLFETLQAQKRGTTPEAVARRQSMSEQRMAPGFIGRMWNNWVYGK